MYVYSILILIRPSSLLLTSMMWMACLSMASNWSRWPLSVRWRLAVMWKKGYWMMWKDGPPPCLLDVERLSMELEKAALDMAYEQYFDWHSTLKNKLPYATRGATQMSQACLSCHVSTALNFMLSSNSVTALHIKGEQDLVLWFFFLPYRCLCMYFVSPFVMSPPSLPMQAWCSYLLATFINHSAATSNLPM